MPLFHEKPVLILSAIAGFFLLVSLGIFLLSITRIPGPLILNFDAFHGVRFFGAVSDVFILWFSGLAITGMNAVLAGLFYKRERVMAYLLVGANVALTLLLLILMAVISAVN